MHSQTSLIAPVLALFACAPEPAGTSEGTSETSSSGASASSSADTSGAQSTTVAASTGTSSSGATTSTTAVGATTTTGGDATTGEPACEPPPEDITLNVDFDEDLVNFQDITLTQHCAVGLVDALTVQLVDCDQEPTTHTLAIDAAPVIGELDLEPGEPVIFDLVIVAPWWWEFQFALRRESSELVLAGLRASSVPIWGGLPSLSPFAVSERQECPDPEIYEDDTDCSFVCGPQYDWQSARAVIEFTRDGQTQEQIDHSAGAWPDSPYGLLVRTAEYRFDVQVSDTPSRWFEFLIYRHK